jgi:hypothetical protein
MTALGGFVLGSLFGGGSTTEVYNNTKVIQERPMTPTEIAEHEERLRRIKEHEPKVKVTLVASRELTEEDFIGLPMTKENVDRYCAWKAGRYHK